MTTELQKRKPKKLYRGPVMDVLSRSELRAMYRAAEKLPEKVAKCFIQQHKARVTQLGSGRESVPYYPNKELENKYSVKNRI